MSGFLSCNIYKVAEKHVNKKIRAAQMEGRLLQLQGDQLEYWDNGGDKPVLVLVHGFGATAKYQWFKQIEWLAARYRVIMPNLNYFGNTKPGEAVYTVQGQVETVHRLLDELKIEHYTLCGVSYGGLVAFEMAQQRPEAVDKLIAFDTPVKFMYEADIAATCARFEVESVEELFAPSNPKGLKKLMYLASMKKSIVPASWLTEFYEDLYAKDLSDKRQLISQLLADVQFYNAQNYTLQMPVLLIWGDNDPVIPSDRGELLRQHVGENAEFHLIHKGAHMPNLTKTKKFDRIFQEFLLRTH
jgi:pimeloyl-ACP methyl ester carboxylesterase